MSYETEQTSIIPVILAGGLGTRLWPFSRQMLPKQFLTLLGQQTLLQYTVDRIRNLSQARDPLFICAEEHRFMLLDQINAIGLEKSSIILEPCARSTAPALAIASWYAMENDPDALLLALPADHIVVQKQHFQEVIKKASLAAKDSLVTFGIVPDRAETGYGYIQVNENLKIDGMIYKVQNFVEKPNLETAVTYLESGDYYWNSGIFLFSAKNYLEELKKYAYEIWAQTKYSFEKARQDGQFIHLPLEEFSQCPNSSIDYAVMEKTEHAMMMPANVGWSDVGSWSSLWELHERDHQGNVSIGDVLLENVENSYVHADSRVVAALGVKDHVIVETKDAVLVAHKTACQNVKVIVDRLRAQQRDETITHKKVYRPWGWYESLEKRPGFQVKRIFIKVGASISLQLHHHRSEHWVVIAGIAQVVRDDEVFVLTKNQSTFIPMNAKHRLTNVGDEALEIIEVQVGEYLHEDDIVRFNDHYGRI